MPGHDAVLFDVDDTLIDTRSAFAAAIAAVRRTFLPHVAVEREVEMRNIARRSRDSVSGFEVSRPNPNARLYVRAFGETPTHFSRDDVMRATLRAARVMLVAPPPHSDWQEATLDAFRALTPAERAALAAHNREMLALIERVEVESQKSA